MSLALNWPELVTSIVDWLSSVLVLDLSTTSPECAVPMTFLAKFVFFLIFPAFLVIAMYTIGCVKKMRVSRKKLGSPTDSEVEALPLPEGWEKIASDDPKNKGRRWYYVDPADKESKRWEHPMVAELDLNGPEAAEKRYKDALADIDDKVISSLWLWAKLLYMTLIDTVFRGWSCFDGALKCVCFSPFFCAPP